MFAGVDIHEGLRRMILRKRWIEMLSDRLSRAAPMFEETDTVEDEFA